jgi:predicted dehydrogenase
VEIEIPFNAPQDGPSRVWHETEAGTCATVFDRVDQYALLAEAFSQAVLDDAPVPIPLSDALANARTIDAVFESARRGAWVDL